MELCENERQRLSNLRERIAIMEQLNFQEDKTEIRRQTKILARSSPKEKVVVERREKSERIQQRLQNPQRRPRRAERMKFQSGVDWKKRVEVAGEAIVASSLLTDLNT